MELEQKINELENKIDANMERIINNMNELHSHEEKINENANNIQKNSYAREILESISNDSIKWYKSLRIVTIALIIVLLMWFSTIAYLVCVLNR